MARIELGQIWRYGVPGVLLGLAVAGWGGGFASAPAVAQDNLGGTGRGADPAAGQGTAGGTFAFTTPIGTGGGASRLFLVDTGAKAFAVYRVDPSAVGKGVVKLEAARQYSWDLRLSDFNNLPPDPSAIADMVRSHNPR